MIKKGMKPKMKNHFRAHQLSIWLRLIPEIHKLGKRLKLFFDWEIEYFMKFPFIHDFLYLSC
jgi:hypothetical protein